MGFYGKACPIILVLLWSTQAICQCPHEDTTTFKRWSDPASWIGGQLPTDEQDVELTEPYLLDVETARLNHITLKNGGRLVFDPTVAIAKLVAEKVMIGMDGSLEVGSSNCPFTGKAEILLTGEHNSDSLNDDEFGQKVIAVLEGGTLEIHGKPKKSWTSIDQSLVPHDCFHYPETVQQKNNIAIIEMNRDTAELLGEWQKLSRFSKLDSSLTSLQESSVVIIFGLGSNSFFDTDTDRKEKFFSLVEEKALKGQMALELRNNWASENDAFVVMIDRKPDGSVSAVEFHTPMGAELLAVAEGSFVVGDMFYAASSMVSIDPDINSRFNVTAHQAMGFEDYELQLVDDVSSWETGDKLVIASTDYNMDQAEEVEVVSVHGNIVKVKGQIRYFHYGDVYEGIDMKAEVGLLTRNVLIHGEMKDECVTDDMNDCSEFNFDSFGGHVKAVKGFKSFNIDNAELTQMGQLTQLGRYPIHFHLCEEVESLVASNSIHDCFSRCITVHLTHGVMVKDNVASNTFGHCYFLEDGGEKNNTFIGNLGLGTKRGILTKSDVKGPSTFWITSPLTSMVGNVAAGADTNVGVGFWHLFPNQPVGPSAGKSFARNEAKHTPITLFKDNKAHSNGFKGLAVFRRLAEDHDIAGCSTYDPREDPLDKHSRMSPAIFDGFTGYRNRKANVIMRATNSIMKNFKLADSSNGVIFLRNMLSGFQLMQDSLIVGQSPNPGTPEYIKIRDPVNGHWKRVHSNISYPFPSKALDSICGVFFNAEGPTHLHGIAFKEFTHNGIRSAGAIEFIDKFNFGMGVRSSVKGLSFENVDSEVVHKNLIDGMDETSMMLNDLDGSLTGTPGNKVMATFPFLADGASCEENTKWNMSICQGNFSRFYINPKMENPGEIFTTKDGEEFDQHFISFSKRRVGFTISQGVPMTMHWQNVVRSSFTVTVTGIKPEQPKVIGFCLPYSVRNLTLTELVFHGIKNRKPSVPEDFAATADEFANDETKKMHFDTEKSLLRVRFSTDIPSTMETGNLDIQDLGDCTGDPRIDISCPAITIDFRRVLDQIDLAHADCTKPAEERQ